jgi:hypothetical protein
MTFVMQIIFMNVTHNAFSFMLPLISPEVRTWWKESKHFGLSTSMITFLVFSIGLVFVFCADFVARRFGFQKEGYLAFITVSIFLSQRHGLGQAFGLSRFYDQRLREKFGPPDARTVNLQNWQRRLFKVFLVLTLPRLLLAEMALNYKWAGAIMNPLSIVAVLIAVAIVVMAYQETNGKFSNKYIFLLRLGPLCFTSFTNPWPYFAVMAIHAMEYLFVTISITRSSYKNEKRLKIATAPQKRYWGLALSLLGLVIVCAQFRTYLFGDLILSQFPQQSFFISLLIALSVTMGFTHFFLDEIMFKMRKPEVRKHITPLLDSQSYS